MKESEKLREMGQALIAMADSMDHQGDPEQEEGDEMPMHEDSEDEQESEDMPIDDEPEDDDMKKKKKAALIMILSKKLGKK